MLTIREYKKVSSLEEAYTLNQKKMNRIIGGMLWLKMQSGNVGTAIDLSGLGLDKIEETEEQFSVGAMAVLRDLERHEGLNNYTDGAVREAVRHIVGVQFRNLATVGGSIFGRYGFSDVLTVFMAMDSYVELYKAGIMPLAEFAKMPYDNDVLVRLIVKKQPLKMAYISHRMTKTDFPVLAAAVSQLDGKWRAVLGATPHRAAVIQDADDILENSLTTDTIEAFARYAADKGRFDSNIRGSEKYRRHLAVVLIRRALQQIASRKENEA